MTPEAKKRKNQKKKLKQRQKKAAEKAVHDKELHETPESTVSIEFGNDSVNRTGSDMTPESDVLPVSSSTNISTVNDTQLEVSDVQELHDEPVSYTHLDVYKRQSLHCRMVQYFHE